jgi:hypothetical protein
LNRKIHLTLEFQCQPWLLAGLMLAWHWSCSSSQQLTCATAEHSVSCRQPAVQSVLWAPTDDVHMAVLQALSADATHAGCVVKQPLLTGYQIMFPAHPTAVHPVCCSQAALRGAAGNLYWHGTGYAQSPQQLTLQLFAVCPAPCKPSRGWLWSRGSYRACR